MDFNHQWRIEGDEGGVLYYPPPDHRTFKQDSSIRFYLFQENRSQSKKVGGLWSKFKKSSLPRQILCTRQLYSIHPENNYDAGTLNKRDVHYVVSYCHAEHNIKGGHNIMFTQYLSKYPSSQRLISQTKYLH